MWATFLSAAGVTPRFADILIKPQAFVRGMVRWDRTDAFERYPEPKSNRRASLRSWFRNSNVGISVLSTGGR
jgi:hypothetical protein